MSEKFTPGAWEIEERSAHFGSYSMYGFSIQTKEHRICMCQTDDDRNIPTMQANAALIATAPAMYEMLKYLADGIRWGGMQHTDRSIAQKIEDLLKKARCEK